jgi:glyoxylase-like metal-dependent hydrolase (beta-lactamase superfamily II)
VVTIDPDYLTEPLVRSATYVRAPNLDVRAPVCQPIDDREAGTTYTVPHFLPGENPNLTEIAVKYKVPIEGLRGGAETTYPAWNAIGSKLPVPTDQYTLKPVYNDASTRIAELADRQPPVTPTYDKVEALHVAGNIYMVAGAGANVAFSVGGDGIIMVDSGAETASARTLAAIRQVAQTFRPAPVGNSALPFSEGWLGTHTAPEPSIRMIINTNAGADHTGGNAAIRRSSLFRPIGGAPILAHDAVQSRMVEDKAEELAVPTNTYFSEKFTLYRFLNNEAVQTFHLPAAISDGDSAVFFRRSDVIVAGDVYNSDIYPPIDVDRGGSLEGEIGALNKLIDMSVTDAYSQGGTMIIPGHGWISDAADVGYYRDMLIIIRDRIQSMIDKGMTLAQIKAAKPTMDYDPLYGRQPGVTAKFVEAAYRSMKAGKSE